MPKPVIFSVAGHYLTEEEIKLFKQLPCIGFILFSRNIANKQQVIELTDTLRKINPNPEIKIFIDQEGGRVARIKPPIAKKLYPSAEHFSTLYNEDPDLAKKEVEMNYYELMQELKSLGIDSPCAPVCDITYSDTNNVIGDRSFGNNPYKVIDLCKAAIGGIKRAEGIAFIKHIPGHGRATLDSHYELPVINAELKELEKTDFMVFKELANENVWAMTAHIIYPYLDNKSPVTTSKKAIEYIRNIIGFKGKLISDDIGMYALHGKAGLQLGVLKKIIRLANQNKDWREQCKENLSELFGINCSEIEDQAIIELCHKKTGELKPYFLETLAEATTMALEAGCDAILHCSGNIEEMQLIGNILYNMEA